MRDPSGIDLPYVISHYRLIRLVGSGGMGAVYEARDRRDDSPAAVKLLHPHLSGDDSFLRRLEREAEVAAVLRSPYTVHILGYGYEEPYHYIAMEYVAGGTLKDALARGPLPVGTALRIAAQVARALREGEARGIVHRDIKPDNVLLGPTGQVKVSDFGIARELGGATLTMPGGFIGTLAYAPPERARDVDNRSDIYSLGATLYHMLAGRPPFEGDITDLIKAHHEQPVPLGPLTGVPLAVVAVVQKCMAKKREDRYQTAHELALELERLARNLDTEQLSGEAATVVDTGAVPPAPPPLVPAETAIQPGGRPRRNMMPLLLGLGGAGAAAAVVAAVVLLSSGGSSSTPGGTGDQAAGSDTPAPTGITAAPIALDALPAVYQGVSSVGGSDGSGNPLFAEPFDTVFDTNGDFYVADFGGRVLKFSGDGETFSASPLDLPDGTTPNDLAIAPDGSVYVSDEDGDRIFVFARDGTLAATLGETGAAEGQFDDVASIAADGDGNLYTVEVNNPRVQVFDPDGAFLRAWPLRFEGVPGGIAAAHDGSSVYVTAQADGLIFRYDAAGTEQASAGEAGNGPGQFNGPGGVTVGSDGTVFVADEGNNRVQMFSPDLQYLGEFGTAGAELGQLSQPVGIAFDSAGYVWVTELGNARVQRFLRQLDGAELIRLTEEAGADSAPSWSPDGTRVAFSAERDGNTDIYAMKADGSEVTRLTDDPAADTDPDWSPDGARIAFVTQRDGNRELYYIGADGNGLQQLTDSDANEEHVDWSPDGEKIAFASDRDGPYAVYIMDVLSTEATRLVDDTTDQFYPDWSPDGTQIAFTSQRDGNEEIYLVNADGRGLTRLTNDPAQDEAPDWSPDGSAIAFHSDRHTGAYRAYAMNADGSSVTRLTPPTAPALTEQWPAWSPDGKDLLVSSNPDDEGNVEIYLVQLPEPQGDQATATPDAAASTQPPDAGSGNEYTVKQGDTLFSIAIAHFVSVDDLAAANGLDPGDSVSPGDVLIIPDD